jgi:alanyl-tRNA synthetase
MLSKFMTAQELREKYLKFFESKGHTIIPSASLVPENDPSVLFTTAGMHPLVPYLLGEKHPGGKRVVNVQKCIRTGDIDEVGDTTHHTFFEMLGNWSFGDYFKKEAIGFSWEFLTSSEFLGLEKNLIAVSVFEGDADAPFDEEAYETWKNLGLSEKRIAKLPKKNNWWGMETGPCGPDSEMFFWVGDPKKVPESFNDDNVLWVEIWNDVFMQYNKTKEGSFEPLAQKNVDTGMGLERTLAAINGLDDNYKTELFWPIIQKIEELSNSKYASSVASFRIIADHLKASVFSMADGVAPLNVGRGYVLRRLIRRAIRHGKTVGISNNFTKQIAEVVIEMYAEVYPELEKNKEFILEELEKEENKFRETLARGLKKLNSFINKEDGNFWFKKDEHNTFLAKSYSNDDVADVLFDLYQTDGFPLELVFEELISEGINLDKNKLEAKFNERLKKHQDLSRTASAGMFKGGLADTGEMSKKYHTATHLLLAALREVLGAETYQKGSNINAERLRFDFNSAEKLTPEQLKKVENLVNQKIQENISVEMVEMSKDEALKLAKVSFDPAKYGDNVKVYKIADYSVELCGGPHVSKTGELGKFKIVKEEASSAGIRRIKAVLE